MGCAVAAVLLVLVKNPFIPDVCASTGYGYPLPLYVSWCECFVANYPLAVNPLYVAFDLMFWAACWKVVSIILNERA